MSDLNRLFLGQTFPTFPLNKKFYVSVVMYLVLLVLFTMMVSFDHFEVIDLGYFTSRCLTDVLLFFLIKFHRVTLRSLVSFDLF